MTSSSASAGNKDSSNFYFKFSGFFSKFISWVNSAGTLWVFAIMFFILADVISRSSLNVPLNGVPELVAYSLIGAVYLQFAHALHVGKFAYAEMFIEPLEQNRPIAAGIFRLFFLAAGFAVFGLIAYGTVFKLQEAWPNLKFGVEDEFTLLVWPLRLIILFGAILVAIKYILLFVDQTIKIVDAFVKRNADTTKTPVGWIYLILIMLIISLFSIVGFSDFSKAQLGAFSLIGVLVLVFTGIHIGVALILLGFVGIWIMFGDTRVAINTVKLASNEFLRNYFFGVVPLFVLMGLLINVSDIGKDTFNVARWALRRIKGGLGIATVFANAVFAAITGSSIASAAVFSKVAVPQMMNHGYTAKFAVGTVAGSSVLGMLIPPSLLLIIYGFVAEQSVGSLFLAAIVPGLLLAGAMSAAIYCMARFWPGYVGHATSEDAQQEDIRSAAGKLFPIIVLILAVMGGIYSGLFTPVEAGAVGAAGALIIATLKRRLTWQKLWTVLVETGHTTVSVLFLVLAANIYGRMLTLSGLPQTMGTFIGDVNLGLYGFMALYILMVIILGMFLESISLMLIVLPLVLPIVEAFGGDLVWFGIVTVIAVEMGLLTPPLGIAVYVVRANVDKDNVTLNEIFSGAFPFVIIMFLVTTILITFPKLSLVFT